MSTREYVYSLVIAMIGIAFLIGFFSYLNHISLRREKFRDEYMESLDDKEYRKYNEMLMSR